MDLYLCPTEVITTFYSLSVSDAAIGGYFSMVLIMSAHTFFFSKNITYMSSVSVFMANASNLIIKSAMCFLSCQNVLIFYSAFAALLLSLKAILISLTNSSQSWVSSSSSNSLIFFYGSISAMLPLSWANTVMILSFIVTTLLLLRNNQISLY